MKKKRFTDEQIVRILRDAQTALPFRIFGDWKGGHYEMVGATGETSNHLFQILEEWNLILQSASVDLSISL